MLHKQLDARDAITDTKDYQIKMLKEDSKQTYGENLRETAGVA